MSSGRSCVIAVGRIGTWLGPATGRAIATGTGTGLCPVGIWTFATGIVVLVGMGFGCAAAGVAAGAAVGGVEGGVDGGFIGGVPAGLLRVESLACVVPDAWMHSRMTRADWQSLMPW